MNFYEARTWLVRVHNIFYQNLPTPVLSVSGTRVRSSPSQPISYTVHSCQASAPLIFYAVVGRRDISPTLSLYHPLGHLSRVGKEFMKIPSKIPVSSIKQIKGHTTGMCHALADHILSVKVGKIRGFSLKRAAKLR